MTWIWTRPLNAGGTPSGPYVRTGQSCNTPPAAVAAAAAARPLLTLAAIQGAFRDVDFAAPALHIQPEGNQTLVNLPTYYQIRWPANGVQPGQIATVHLLGRAVRIRPLTRSYTYRFGDGTTQGPTSDPGGTYPTGHITHTYRHTTRAPATATARYTGEFSVDRGPWQPVDQTIDITGTPTTITVHTARTRLQAGSAQR